MDETVNTESPTRSGATHPRTADSPEVLERFHAELSLVAKVAGYMRRRVGAMVEYDDLLSAGREGLLDASRRYDAAQGVPFRAFASFRVRGAMIDCMRKMGKMSRRAYERLAALEAAATTSEGHAQQTFAGTSREEGDAETELEDRLAASAVSIAMGVVTASAEQGGAVSADAGDPEQALEGAELIAVAKRLVDGLPAREAQVIRAHYFEGQPLDEVARATGLNRAWVFELRARALEKLTKRMRQSV